MTVELAGLLGFERSDFRDGRAVCAYVLPGTPGRPGAEPQEKNRTEDQYAGIHQDLDHGHRSSGCFAGAPDFMLPREPTRPTL